MHVVGPCESELLAPQRTNYQLKKRRQVFSSCLEARRGMLGIDNRGLRGFSEPIPPREYSLLLKSYPVPWNGQYERKCAELRPKSDRSDMRVKGRFCGDRAPPEQFTYDRVSDAFLFALLARTIRLEREDGWRHIAFPMTVTVRCLETLGSCPTEIFRSTGVIIIAKQNVPQSIPTADSYRHVLENERFP
ncbi:hypothetical protein CISG_09914 [Coccidioides immitis RMSCC 3703]|uniref:Uncharacterized protein n=1 Tax=Coccidioides immitis RMSCC 3703 TaxID=454286 RepID=A0A0J8QKW5_COCIT|nr:hypothetical protein CISG_09914 [Coccidioides immitis RMSCC 3703]